MTGHADTIRRPTETEVSQTPRKTQLTVLPGEIWADIFGGEAA